jgi:hypothetical protein
MIIPVRNNKQITYIDIDQCTDRELRKAAASIAENILAYPPEDLDKLRVIAERLEPSGLFPWRRKKNVKKINRGIKLRESGLQPKQRYRHPKIKRLEPDLQNERIKSSFDEIPQYHPQVKAALARTWEIQEALSDTHYCLNHGQNLSLVIVEIAMHCLFKKFSTQDTHHLRPLRHPSQLRHADKDISWFKRRISRDPECNDGSFREDLICADIFLKSTAPVESAIDFVAGQRNVAMMLPRFRKNLLLDIAENYFSTEKQCKQFTKECLKAAKQLPPGGTFYTIAIPKEKFHKMCYLSESFGTPISKKKYTVNHLDRMQAGEDPCGKNDIPAVTDLLTKRPPQVRVQASKLKSENGVFIFRSSTESDKTLQKIENQVDDIIERVINPFYVDVS